MEDDLSQMRQLGHQPLHRTKDLVAPHFWRDDGHGDLGVAQDVRQLGLAQHRADGNDGAARLADAKEGVDELEAVGQHQGDALSLGQPQLL